MSTRASIIMKENGEPIMALYKHWDGYPDGLGKDLQKIIEEGKMVNGLALSPQFGKVFNGAGCLFASIISILKKEPGDVYITSINSVGSLGEEYIYEINVKDNQVELTHKEV